MMANRNESFSFSAAPSAEISRSTFDRGASYKTSFNVGQIVPFYVDEVLPGDTMSIDTAKVVRLQTMLTPVMDNIYLDTYFFFVPNRLVWSHWKEFCGENSDSAWIPQAEYSVPQIVAPADTGFAVGTIADYMGIPTGVPGLSVNALPIRAYALICDQWFRDENLSSPLSIPVDDTTVTGVNTGTFVSDVAKGGLPYTAAKYRDYFTSALPSAQKGPAVQIPVSPGANYPVVPLFDTVPDSLIGSDARLHAKFVGTSQPASGYYAATYGYTGNQSNYSGVSGSSQTFHPIPDNLWAINDGNQAMATINQLRLAFQIQKLYERDARGGTRYIEILKSHFGVISPDARLQRAEYLGGNRIPINVNQVLQQSGTEADGTPQGTPVGVSLTTDNHSDFTKSFVEHGFVIGVCVARYHHTYQQGLERFWSRKTRFDYFWPVLAHISEQALLNKEIYAQGPDVVDDDGEVIDDQVFGYQEAWADYRYKPNRVTGEMRSQYSQSLDVWHLGDDYAALPVLSDSWIREDKANVDRVLSVTSAVSNQLFMDVYVKNRSTRPMPMYSVPGLIDHY